MTSAVSQDSPNDSLTTRVVFESNATAKQLEHGVIVQLANASNVFQASGDEDVSKGILTSITVKSIYSDCSEPVTFALNLYNASEKEPSVKNNEGWLHTPSRTDFGTEATAMDGGASMSLSRKASITWLHAGHS